MLYRFFSLTIAAILLGVASIANAQGDSKEAPTTQYEKFLKRTDVVKVIQSYPLADMPGGGGTKITAKVAWALGENQKVYAVEISNRIIDFDQLASIQEGLDKMIAAVKTSFETLNASSISYASASGVSASYYSYLVPGSDKPKTSCYIAAGSYAYESPNIDGLLRLRGLVAQGREKLISLGAK